MIIYSPRASFRALYNLRYSRPICVVRGIISLSRQHIAFSNIFSSSALSSILMTFFKAARGVISAFPFIAILYTPFLYVFHNKVGTRLSHSVAYRLSSSGLLSFSENLAHARHSLTLKNSPSSFHGKKPNFICSSP